MAAILVDYENVFAANGLKGAEYLGPQDKLYIFYSNACGKIKAEYFDQIENSGCNFRLIKLVRAGKNALDFYIAAECGILSQQGETQIVIVSNDKGYEAVLDFFKSNEQLKSVTLRKAANIENGIAGLDAATDAERRRLILSRTRQLDLAEEYARFSERLAIKNRIKEAFEGSEFVAAIPGVIELVEAGQTDHKKIYTSTLHNFGRRDGLKIYSILKKVV